LAIGLASRLPAFSPKEPPRGPLVKSAAGQQNLPRLTAARQLSSRQPTGMVLAGRSGSVSGSVGQAAGRRRERPGRAALILQSTLDLAEADEAINKNPAKAKIVQRPAHQQSDIQIWTDSAISCLIDAHPDHLRALPELAVSCGMRESEIFGIALEDFDFDEKIVRVRRQIKKPGTSYIFALPKNDRERIIPLSDWVMEAIQRHIGKFPPEPCTLSWEKLTGQPHTCSILFRWHTDGQHIKARNYSETVWKPALVKAGLIPEPASDQRGRRRYVTTRREGLHQLRHYYASVMLAGGVSIKELAEYLGHSDPAFTLRVYAHMLPCSHDRARAVINDRFTRTISIDA